MLQKSQRQWFVSVALTHIRICVCVFVCVSPGVWLWQHRDPRWGEVDWLCPAEHHLIASHSHSRGTRLNAAGDDGTGFTTTPLQTHTSCSCSCSSPFSSPSESLHSFNQTQRSYSNTRPLSLKLYFQCLSPKHSSTHFPEFKAGAHHLRRQWLVKQKRKFLFYIYNYYDYDCFCVISAFSRALTVLLLIIIKLF